MRKKIDYRFKILYAIGIIMVVAGHCEGGGIPLDIAGWFPFNGVHLTLFVFASGYFYKEENEKNIIRYILKKVKSLLVPLYIYNFVYGIIVVISHAVGLDMGGDFNLYNLLIAPVTNGHQFIYNMGGWFVVPLFIIEAANVLFRKIVRMIRPVIPEYIFFVISLVIGLAGNQLCLAGNQLAVEGYYTGLWLVITRCTYFLPFFCLGIFYKNTLEKYEKRIPGIIYFAVIFDIKLLIIMYFGKSVTYTPSWCNDFSDGAAMPIIVSFLGIALWMHMSTILEPILLENK